ncbi:MAG: polysaccharide biosynthesis protein GumB [Sphingomonas bacterium]|jgi:polysaccharide export outer membrane protein|nr:polysaccharide biosynthesis protein GumB [Sphingomonas bacterium]MDB5718446.1 polysaccharide biosynthesis protein GumB [Sphingomonas bacterium]
MRNWSVSTARLHPLLVAPLLFLGACSNFSTDLPSGVDAYKMVPAASTTGPRDDYRVSALDVLSVNVFQEPDLSVKDLQVDAGGNILFPLIGNVAAEGKTVRELSNEIATRLGERYLVSPQVSVSVTSSSSQRVTVEGSVTEPGVYEISGSTTLLEALARAKSPTRVAKLDQVAVFRVVDGQRLGAVFNVNAIRAGRAPDPEIRGGDLVVVGFSAAKGAFRDFLTTAPILNLFRPF